MLQRFECLDLKFTSCGCDLGVLEYTVIPVARDHVKLLLVLRWPEALICRQPGASLTFLDTACPTEELGGEVLPRHLR